MELIRQSIDILKYVDKGVNYMDAGLKNLITKAENGDVDAMVMVGDCFTKGINTRIDDVQSHKYYKMAADKGHVKASVQVGIDFINGIGVKSDKKQGVKYLTYAADHGEAFAQFYMGVLYENGEIGMSKTLGHGMAIMYYEMAAKQGNIINYFPLFFKSLCSKKT